MRMKEAAAMLENDLCDAKAAMSAREARQKAAQMTDPKQRAKWNFIASKWEAALEEELEKKRRGEIDTSYVHDDAEVKRRQEEGDRLSELLGRLSGIPSSREAELGASKRMLERFGLFDSAGNLNKDLFDENGKFDETRLKDDEPTTPNQKAIRQILDYLKPFNENRSGPKSFEDMVNRAEPLLQSLGVMMNYVESLVDGHNERVENLVKLQKDVKKWKTIPTSQRSAYSLDNLAKVETKWRNQVSEIWMPICSGLMFNVMQGPSY